MLFLWSVERQLLVVNYAFHIVDLGTQLAVLQDAKLSRYLQKVCSELIAGRPRAHSFPGALPCRVVLEVVYPQLRLQLRGSVGILEPGGPADCLVPVDDDVVLDALLVEAQRLSESAVPGSDDAMRVGVSGLLPLPLPNASHDNTAGHLLGVKQLPVSVAGLEDELELLGLNTEPLREQLLHLAHLGRDLDGKSQGIVVAGDCQRDLTRRMAPGAEPLHFASDRRGGRRRHNYRSTLPPGMMARLGGQEQSVEA